MKEKMIAPVVLFWLVASLPCAIMWRILKRFQRTGLYAITNQQLFFLESGSVQSYAFPEIGSISEALGGDTRWIVYGARGPLPVAGS